MHLPGVAIFSILAAIAQLERDLIASRVKIGLENARAKGRQIGRKKMRDSDLIRKLLKSGCSYRQISKIAGVSHGSVSAERAAMKREEEELKRKIAERVEAEKNMQEGGVIFPAVSKVEIPPNFFARKNPNSEPTMDSLFFCLLWSERGSSVRGVRKDMP